MIRKTTTANARHARHLRHAEACKQFVRPIWDSAIAAVGFEPDADAFDGFFAALGDGALDAAKVREDALSFLLDAASATPDEGVVILPRGAVIEAATRITVK